jgi:hypothetical protein
MIRRSRFVFGGGTWETELAVRPWMPYDHSIGGMRIAASGVPASFIVRRDRMLEVTCRVFEAEWLDCLALIEYGQTMAPITWHPDIEDPEPTAPETVSVYLDHPAPGERWSPTRLAEFPQCLEVPLMLRGVSGALPWRPFFVDKQDVYVGQMASGVWAFTDEPAQESGSLAMDGGVLQISDDPNEAGKEQWERYGATRLVPGRGRVRPRSS